jgi:hypothetical protein
MFLGVPFLILEGLILLDFIGYPKNNRVMIF